MTHVGGIVSAKPTAKPCLSVGVDLTRAEPGRCTVSLRRVPATGEVLTFKGWVHAALDQTFGLAPICNQCGGGGGSDQDEPYACPVEGCDGTVSWASAAEAFWWTISRVRDQLWAPSLGFEREQAIREVEWERADT